MPQKLTCIIPYASISYEIEIQSGLLSNQKELVKYLSQLASRFAIITNAHIASLYGDQLYRHLSEAGLDSMLLSFPIGEEYKSRQTKEILEDKMFEKGFGRDTCLIALGGGIVTDVGGYVAATYCRGIPLVMIPTSLLAMVDASIGGKTGVNVPYGKNLIGSTYQPQKVFIDPSLLKTLPFNELRNGIVEMIKHGLIASYAYFEYLETHCEKLLKLDSKTLEDAIFESCRIKKEIVEQDEKEVGKRRLLNFGHTVGHALENLMRYAIPHGEAVAIGLLVESHLAVQLGHLDCNSFDRIRKILSTYALPLKLPSHFPIQTILDAMIVDKKSLKGRPRFAIIDRIGSSIDFGVAYCTYVDETLIRNALQWMNDEMR